MSRTTRPTDDQEIIDAIQGGPTGATTVGQNSRTVTTAGTPVQLSASSVPCKRVWIQAYESNGLLNGAATVVVCVGNATVVAAAGSRTGRALTPTEGDWFEVSNLNLLYIDATDNLAKVSYHYEN